MTLKYSQDASISKLSFRNVDGKKLGLSEGCSSPNLESYGVIKFILYNEEPVNVFTSLSLFCLALLLWTVFDSFIFFLISAFALVFYCKYFITSSKKDTLLIVPSIGIHITIEKTFAGFNSYEFLPWDTIEDVFINEVIIRQRVLYYLTFKVKESVDGRDQIRLVPLFQDLLPEKRCLVYIYTKLANVIGSSKKKNLYHRTDRNAKEFTYGKELMKVVRRIIKSQPRQGQQFCTKHILATYNHTSWTRQDKMFAMLKFQEHTKVATVSRAITLTVKVFKTENSMPNDMIFHAKNEQEAIKSLIHINKEYTNEDIKENDKVDIESSNDNGLKINSEDSDKHISNLNINYNSSNLNSPTSINNSDITDKPKITKHNKKSSLSKSANTEKRNVRKNKEYSVLFEEERTKKNECHDNIETLSSLNQFEFNEITEQEKNKAQQINSNSADDINGANDEGVTDSVNLPYQYLIEKEIENARKQSVCISLLDDNKLIQKHAKDELGINSSIKSENKHTKKVIKENNECDKNVTKEKLSETSKSNEEEHTKNTSKSSNITDLIMKGCMFTIQQDKDSVSVLEQKTKSDVDEVLENSEKVETKEGEKCLLNSSLLKLENLVTMIEAPKKNITSNYKSKIAIGNNIPLHSTFTTKDFITNEHITKPTSLMGPFTSSFSSQNISTMNQLFAPTLDETHSTELKPNFLQANSLLDPNKTVLEDCVNNSNLEVTNTILDSTSNHVSNTPRIISNQVITIDQMPLGLRNIVKRKLSRTNASTNNAHKSNPQYAQICPKQLELSSESVNLENKFLDTKSESNTAANYTNALSICSNLKVKEETVMSCKGIKRSHCYETKDDNAQMENDETVPTIQEKIYSSIDKTERHKRRKKQQDCEYDTEKKVKMPAHISNIVKQKYCTMPNKLQDITEEFYQDLMQHHTHNKTVDCKGRRKTRKSLYVNTDVENENIRVEMLKFIEDITRGVKVVVKRMSTKNISSILRKSSSLAYIN
ncbi:hypothetical protein KPH14_012474 [Odynerus spinipes]|uniref:Phosphatidylinositol N-acetylglucosaminyltransferase subunit H conserved domain-containing protein n=1 Tax=Odynerus spinipes TaxID=1348599 RepID=A0AAD9RI59_9HYME|nr:hypothetical protein KPH14_012474 [Odynerus spinipes]